MKKEDIHWDDWHRILVGAAPTEFLLEVLFRTLIMYFALLIILRLMGKRMGGVLTIAELSVMVTLGAIICVPMQIPDKGILQGVLALICALAFLHSINLWGFKNEKIEKLLQGEESLIVKDGILMVKALSKSRITKQQLYGVLRSQGIHNLGEVERVYLEGSGLFSVFRYERPKLGLSVLPPKDDAILDKLNKGTEVKTVCSNCGMLPEKQHEMLSGCINCHHKTWETAIL